MNTVEQIIKDKTLTYEQKVVSLARTAENTLNVLNISEDLVKLKEQGIICDLFEGSAPYRPRYITPDYEVFFKNGSEFLGLEPPKDIWEATHNLMIIYKHVPSITTMPVYIGNLDTLLEPFIEDEEEAFKAIKLFLRHIDRTITDSFCHGNIGPFDTKAGRLILRAERELENAIPNMTLKYDSEKTSDELACEAIKTALVTAKPSFANDKMYREDFGGDYAIASCYNGLSIGGGSYTLARLNLFKAAKTAKSLEDFMDNVLPYVSNVMMEYEDERIRYIVEESNFFETSFLVKEGLISRDKFTAMFGLIGLAECVNHLIGAEKLEDKFGHSEAADKVGIDIIEKLNEMVNNHYNKYCTDGKFLLHAQVGIETDFGTSPGCRIPIGEEPEIWDHLRQSGMFHKHFKSGIGDIFPFEKNAQNNPQYILDIIKGSFNVGMRYFSLYSSDSDVIRITGYLVKKSDMERLDRGESVAQDTVVLGLNSVKNSRILERKVR